MKKIAYVLSSLLLGIMASVSAQTKGTASPHDQVVDWYASIEPTKPQETIVIVSLKKEDNHFIYTQVLAIVQYRSEQGTLLRTDNLDVTDSTQPQLIGGQVYRRRFNNGYTSPVSVVSIQLNYIKWVRGTRPKN